MQSRPSDETCAKKDIELISLAVVAYNEQSYLPALLEQICSQDFPHERMELVLVDSDSTDGTREIMDEFARKNAECVSGFGFAKVQVLDNKKRIQAAGWNCAIASFTGDALIRVDAHAFIPEDFVSANVAVLNEGEFVCGGMRPTCIAPGEETSWRKTLYAAEESAFGSSVASYRRAPEARYVSSLFHACYRREVFDSVGFFNEELLRTEDNDFHYRVRQAGFRIKLDPRISSKQFIRSSLSKMLKQKYGNGYWIGRTVFVQPKCLELYHFAPFVLVCGACIMALIALLFAWQPLVVCALLYSVLCVLLAVRAAYDSKDAQLSMVALPFVFMGIHLSYGVGTLVGLVAGVTKRKG